ncbi:hypothetical protein AGMMS49925_07250 [Deltaproteobacteria bacterium]|nr:hypothetical protein AGMMS49925_07250 [Deltaproteobacteria bacterium]
MAEGIENNTPCGLLWAPLCAQPGLSSDKLEQSLFRAAHPGFPILLLKSIANNAEIDVIWEKWQEKLEPLREQLNSILKTTWEDWEIPREVDTT